MQKNNIAFQMVIAISLLSLTVTVSESFAQEVEPRQVLEVRGDPASADTSYQILVSDGEIFRGPNANGNDIVSQERTQVDGNVITTGFDDWEFTGTVTVTADHHVITYVDGVENESINLSPPVIDIPSITKVLVINGDPTSDGKANYRVKVSGDIMAGPNANPNDKISSDKKTLWGKVAPTGGDSFFYTGEIVSIISTESIVAVADGASSNIAKAQFLKIKGDPASADANYQVVVTGDIMFGPHANSHDQISFDGTTSTLNGKVSTTGKDSFYISGSMAPITSDNNVFVYLDGILQ